jgi:putative protease
MPPKKKIKLKRKKRIIKKRVAKRRVTKKIKVSKRRPLKKVKPVKTPALKPEGKVIGTVTHYFPHVMAAVVKLKAPLAIGDSIKIKGHTTDFTQNVTSLQINHVPINSAKKGQEIGLLVNSRVRQHDVVYKI